ncbi:MAG: hypothetical protein JXB38_01925 [Anaerolineales bacterium]|nr:hypothetical protein [Anaerolineales bacterium]
MLFVILLLLISACATQPEPAQQTQTAVAEVATAHADLVRWATETEEAKPTITPTATHTPTVTLTPLPTYTPQPTITNTVPPAESTETAIAGLTAPKGDGVYLVGVDIQLGTWQSSGEDGDACYWVRRKYDAIVLGEYSGPPGVSMTIQPEDYQVEFRGCGTWEYVVP